MSFITYSLIKLDSFDLFYLIYAPSSMDLFVAKRLTFRNPNPKQKKHCDARPIDGQFCTAGCILCHLLLIWRRCTLKKIGTPDGEF